MDDYQSFIHKSRYARWLPEQQRREDWDETVWRYTNYIVNHAKVNNDYTVPNSVVSKISDYIYIMKAMPSMRAMMTAGLALDRCNVAAYNCAYLPIDNPRAFDEMLYILMCGTGVGFSVERENVDQLPIIPATHHDVSAAVVVQDSKEGWAGGLREIIASLYRGEVPTWDLSLLRPAGARLKTFGGRSSGPAPLDALFTFVCNMFLRNVGVRLSTLDVHDLACKIGDCVVVGGVRRSALISLSNLQDDRMRHAKDGQWYLQDPHRALANNSTVYKEKPDVGSFMREWTSLYESKSGERGFFNRQAASNQAARSGRRTVDFIPFGTNPCSEIILRPYQFCNLTEIVVREDDTLESLKAKAEVATILGTLQATLVDFKYLRPIWKQNTEEEALLGVSLTGIFDCKWMTIQGLTLNHSLEELRNHVIDTNKDWAERLGINQATATTCVKPSGTVSQLVDSASGIHPRYSKYYIRRVRADAKDPLAKFMQDQGVPWEFDTMRQDGGVLVFAFPIQAPDNAVLRSDMSAIEHLELWKTCQEYWCEHKPSITVLVREEEWIPVGSWLYSNFDICSGVSFLPYDDHTYTQAPYEEVEELEYQNLVDQHTGINWYGFVGYEVEDNTAGVQTLACSADSCEVVDLT